MINKADKNLIKLLNEKSILKLIRDCSPISIVEIAKRTQMSKVAVYEIINRLFEEKLVTEIGKAESTSRGGKKPSLIKLNGNSLYVIGILFKRKETQIALANIESNIIDKETIQFKVGSEMDDVMQILFERIETILKRNHVKHEKLISIGIGIPGLIDYQKGQLRFAHTLGGWGNRPIASLFTERYNIPALLENDVKLVSLAESLMGSGKNYSDIVCIWIGEGIGAGIIHNGQLYRGVQSSAGEIGYMELGSICYNLEHLYFGQKYFGDILSEEYLLNTIQNSIRKEKSLAHLALNNFTLQTVFQLAEQKNELICKILDEYAYILCSICDNFVKTLNPGAIILNGNVIKKGDYILNKVKSYMHDRIQEIPISGTDIIKAKLFDKAGITGTIILALETLFEPTISMENHNNFKLNEMKSIN